MLPSLLALLVVFGLLNPEATILLMFILPVKAKYLSYGTVLITGLTFLAKANSYGAYHLGGILFGFLYFKGPKQLFDSKLTYLRCLKWQLKRKRAGFRVIDGDKDNGDKPTYH
jgi:membrane associated rhomboid family serine protease